MCTLRRPELLSAAQSAAVVVLWGVQGNPRRHLWAAVTSPTQRSLAVLRARGCLCWISEHYNAFSRRRVDGFGFADILCLTPGETGVLAVQTTTSSNLAARRTKIQALSAADLWLACGNRICLHGWSRKGARGKRKAWTLREEVLLHG